jgi:hypothetical protein
MVLEPTLPSENRQTLDSNVQGNGSSGRPPNDWVTNKVDLTMVLTPEIDATAQDRPRSRAGIPRVRLNEASVCFPHYLLKLPEFAKETRSPIVDFLGIFANHWVLVGLDIPDAVWKCTSFGAGHFLLFETPFGKLDLVREKNAACHRVYKLELGLNGPQIILAFAVRQRFYNLDAEKIVRVAFETFIAVCGDFLLPIDLANWRSLIMRVESSVRRDMVQAEGISILNICQVQGIPRVGSNQLGFNFW